VTRNQSSSPPPLTWAWPEESPGLKRAHPNSECAKSNDQWKCSSSQEAGNRDHRTARAGALGYLMKKD